jgi:predicted metal-binding membrane protein
MQHRLVAVRRFPRPSITPAVVAAGFAWLVLLLFSLTGDGTVIRHDRLLQGGPPLWLATLLFIAGWQVMLWAMMVPASFHAFNRYRSRRLVAFAVGYLAVWTAFGFAIFLFDAGVHATVNHWPWLAAHPWLIAGTTLVVVGTYQLSDLKMRSLDACRRYRHAPATAKPGADGAVHGIECLGSSWALMLVAFALGAGSLVTMAALAGVMVWEVSPWGTTSVKLLGYCLIGLGVVILAGPIAAPPWWIR